LTRTSSSLTNTGLIGVNFARAHSLRFVLAQFKTSDLYQGILT
jgi:hypothetical protein